MKRTTAVVLAGLASAGAELLAGEVLALSVDEASPNAPLTPHSVDELGLTFWLRVVD